MSVDLVVWNPPEIALLGVNLYRTVYTPWQVEKGLNTGYFSPKMTPLGVNLYRICYRRWAEKGAKAGIIASKLLSSV